MSFPEHDGRMRPGDDLAPSARAALASIRARAQGATQPVPATWRVALHFHPEIDIAGEPVLRRILEHRRYLSQFATGTSNGGVTAVPGGDRMRWESRLFGDAYAIAAADERPIYGAVDADGDRFGPAPRFGSAHLRLRADTLARATFAYPDSALGDAAVGALEHLPGLILAAQSAAGDPLNRYVEAHVHGGVRVPDDVEAVVLDPSFDDREVLELARAAGIRVEWHPGFRAPLAQIEAHPEYRGAVIADLARVVAAGDDVLTPAHLAAARRERIADEQSLKGVWHCIARFGRPGQNGGGSGMNMTRGGGSSS
ncbi:DUF3626 domain-containing protein [Microbacterium sp. NPDC091313]